MTSSEAIQDANLAQTVLKALDILDCVANANTPLPAPEIAKRCGMSRPTAYRLLTTLQSRGFITNSDHEYRLGSKILSLSRILLDSMDLPTLSQPFLRELSEASGETTYVSILDGTQLLYISKVESQHIIRSHCTIGTRNPLHSSSMGKAILSNLPPDELNAMLDRIDLVAHTEHTITNRDQLLQELECTRLRGYAIDNLEMEENVRCVGAPIFNHMGYPFAAISLSGPAFRLPVERLHEFAPLVLKAAHSISSQLGYLKPIKLDT